MPCTSQVSRPASVVGGTGNLTPGSTSSSNISDVEERVLDALQDIPHDRMIQIMKSIEGIARETR